jgi:hypothetical protein
VPIVTGRVLRAAQLFSASLDAAALVCVQGDHVAFCSSVCGFEDVDFPVERPVVCVREPQGGPGSTAVGCVDDVEDE